MDDEPLVESPGGAPQRPLFWLCLGFLAGVAAGLRLPVAATPGVVLCGVGLVLAAAGGGRGRLALVGGLLAAAGLGLLRADRANAVADRQPLAAWLDRPVDLRGVLTAPPTPRSEGVRCDLALDGLAADGRWRPVSARVRVSCPAPSEPLRAGDRVELRATLRAGATAGNPGQFSERRWLRREGYAAAGRADAPPRVVTRGAGARLARGSQWLRERLCGSLVRTMPGPAARAHADLLSAMVFGLYAAPVDEPLEQAFRRAGVVHVLVASGTQVSLLLGLVFLAARLLPVPGAVSLGVAVVAVGGYVLVTGPEPSILRAAVMGLLVFGGLASGRDPDLVTSLALAAAVLVVIRPLVLGEIGFQLSFAATAGLVGLGLPLARRCGGGWRGWLGGLVAFTLAAQAFVAPLLVYHFRQLSLIGPVANLPVIPVSGLLVALGLLASLAGTCWPAAAALVNTVSHALLAGFVQLVGWFARLPGAYLDPVVVTPTALAGSVALLVGATVAAAPDRLPFRPRPNWRAVLTSGLAVLAVIAAGAAWRSARAGLMVTVFDVGQGDAILVRTPSGRTALIDGGPRVERAEGTRDAGEDVLVPALMLHGVRRLDLVIGTHAHADHLGGLAAVVDAYPVGRVLLPDLPHGEAVVDRLVAAARRRGVTPELVRRGAVLPVGDGARLWVLWPPPRLVPDAGEPTNNNALVLKLTWRQASFLLASDLEAAGERLLCRHGGDLRATVLKVPHQGADGSCTAELLDRVQPRHAVISVGPNAYGHPGAATLERLRERGVMLHRTDWDGQVTYRTKGSTLTVDRYGRD